MELICHISLAAPDLLETTAAEYAAEIEAVTAHCYECGEEEFCGEHQKLVNGRMRDLEALTLGMLKLECK